ncbi:plasmid fertility inhibition factor family protein [Paraburkholderia youngii]|uniref:plasmid fertility inhibition factor family protein n=1 Tax=Paraburkholderia youngii TaxID=2782701 RepID=UPI003D22C541
MKTFQGIKTYGYRREAVFKIATTAGDAYMSISRTNYMNDERAVVEVDRARFFELWKAAPYSIHRAQAHGDEQSWRSDYKFHHAVDGFSHGEPNPVPLANISCLIAHERIPEMQSFLFFFRRKVRERLVDFPYVAFTNGVTRTIWLAAHQAECFPVECDAKQAPLLHSLAGTEGSNWTTVEKLIPDASYA